MSECPPIWKLRRSAIALGALGAISAAVLWPPGLAMLGALAVFLWNTSPFPAILATTIIVLPVIAVWCVAIVAAVSELAVAYRVFRGDLRAHQWAEDGAALFANCAWGLSIVVFLAAVSVALLTGWLLVLVAPAITVSYACAQGWTVRWLRSLPAYPNWWAWHESTLEGPVGVM